MRLLRRILAALDAFQQHRAWLSLPVAVMRKTSDDQGGSLSALIAYYGFLAVFPLLLVFTAVLGFVLAGYPSFKAHVLHSAENSFPSLSGYISHAVSGSNVALGVGLTAAMWAGLGVTRATERAMNSVWDIPIHERPNMWWSRVRGLGMLGILGATFLVSTALASLRGVGGLFGAATDALAVAGPLALNFVLYLLAFQVLTNRHLAWRSVVPGAVVGAAGWTALQNLGSYYVRHEVAHASQLYGSLAVVIGLLAWIYLGARLTLYAAEVNVVLAYRLWPRSLTGGVATEADRLVLRRQAQEYQSSTGEKIEVVFASTVASSTAEAPEGDGEATALITHLKAFFAYRKEAAGCHNPKQRQVLVTYAQAEARQVAAILLELARRDEIMAAAFEAWSPR